MARVTVEDCLDKVESKFDLVLLASHRARKLSTDAEPLVSRDRDKHAVVALREFAASKLVAEDVQEEIIHELQQHVDVEDIENASAIDQNTDSAQFVATPLLDSTQAVEQERTEDDLLDAIPGLGFPAE